MSDDASQEKADELMVKAINRALAGWSKLDEALKQLDQDRATLKVQTRGP